MHYAIIVIKKILHNYKKNFFGTMKKFLHNYKKIVSHNLSFLSWYNIKMDPKNMRLYVRNKSYFIVEKYQKIRVFMMKMHTIIMVLMLIEYHYTKKKQKIFY